jgi:diadenosine tetraphosphate (Ap4A) HIT family hydrolase
MRDVEAEDCPVCREGARADVVAELSFSWVTAPREAPLPGYACVVAKRHVEEPFHLPPAELLAFWVDSMVTAKVLAALYEPRKLNYEIHGNTLPHLHLHLYPRFAGDPFEGGPIDPSRTAFTRTPEELRRIGAALAAARS